MYAMKVKSTTSPNPINNNNVDTTKSNKSSSETSVWKKKSTHEEDETKSTEQFTKSTSPSLTPNPYAMENYSKDIKLQKKVQRQSKEDIEGSNRQQIPAPNTTSNIEKSPLSQVRLTPLFPTPPNPAHAGFSGVMRQNNSPNITTNNTQLSHPHTNTNNSNQQLHQNNNVQRVNTHQIPRHHQHNRNQNQNGHNQQQNRRRHFQQHNQHRNNQQQQQQHVDYTGMQCPHGNLSAEELINIKIRKRNVCYVVGLPIHVATEIKLRSGDWFGQFGNIATIAINRNSKSIQANSIPAHITYDNDISALNAINFCNKFVFADGRKLKATFGTQHYCRWFIAANKKCTNVFCGFRHSWCRQSDIITQKDINDFKAIPAGAYTSRNIENQPMGLQSRSQEYNATHHQLQPPIMQCHSANHTPNMIAHTSNNVSMEPIVATTNQSAEPIVTSHINPDTIHAPIFIPSNDLPPGTADTLTHSNPHSLANSGGSRGGSAAEQKTEETIVSSLANSTQELKINADPYTFYLTNSASTPTGPSPIVNPAQHTVVPPNISMNGGGVTALVGHSVNGVNVAQVQPRINPNIYDSRNALMQQIMQRNAAQQIEIDALKQQVRVLQECELKSKSELHKYWQNEKKNEKVQKDFKILEAKHDSLQIKYLALNGKYKALLNSSMNGGNTQHFESWKCIDVIRWMMNLDNARYEKYEAELGKNIKMENVDGACLSSLDKGDLHRLGITDFKDKKDLMLRIKELVQVKEEKKTANDKAD